MKKFFNRTMVTELNNLPMEAASNSTGATTPEHSAKAQNGMVVSAHPEATQIGIDILQKGGTAVDAAVAVGFAMGVLEPNASGLGGGGFIMIQMAGEPEPKVIDFREAAPAHASSTMFPLDSKGIPLPNQHGLNPSLVGGKAVAVPGETAGLLAALEKFGTFDRETVITPAVRLAQRGIQVSERMNRLITNKTDRLQLFPSSAELYLNNGHAKKKGDQIQNLALAETLTEIIRKGHDAIYRGEIARDIARAVQADDGLMEVEDLHRYQPRVQKPLKGTYRGYDIYTPPPPSSGGTHLLELLNIMENSDPEKGRLNDARFVHLWAEAMKLVYADRAEFSGDSDLSSVPTDRLISKQYARNRFEQIQANKALDLGLPGDPWSLESGSTTHISVTDAAGNMVSCTKTINYFFGSGITVPGRGILLNNEMDDFTKTEGHPNSIQGNKRPQSCMSPVIILKEGQPFATLGTPGGNRILSSLALLISAMIDFKMDIQSAIEAPKFNQVQTGGIRLEARISPVVRSKLQKMGHQLELKKPLDLYFGGINGITRNPSSGELHGGSDPRRDGMAQGY